VVDLVACISPLAGRARLPYPPDGHAALEAFESSVAA